MEAKNERHMRVDEFADRIGYSIATIRKKIARREIAYRKVGRIITIPESSLTKLLGDLTEAVTSTSTPRPAA